MSGDDGQRVTDPFTDEQRDLAAQGDSLDSARRVTTSESLPADDSLLVVPAATPEQAPLPLHIRRDPVRWLAALRRGVAAAKSAHRRAGTVPYGYRETAAKTGVLVEDRHEQDVLSRVIELRVTGLGATLQGIADDLNAGGLRTRRGTLWRRGTVAARLYEAGVLARGRRPRRAA